MKLLFGRLPWCLMERCTIVTVSPYRAELGERVEEGRGEDESVKVGCLSASADQFG